MKYEQAKLQRDSLEKIYKETGAALKKFPTNSIGLTSNEAKLTKEYQQAKRSYEQAFAELRAFNVTFTKEFKKELQEERALRYSKQGV